MVFQPFPLVNPSPLVSALLDDDPNTNNTSSHTCPLLDEKTTPSSVLLAVTDPVSLSSQPTPLNLSSVFETPGIASASPSVVFGAAGYYLIQLKLSVSTACHIDPAILFISTSTTGNVSLSPDNYISAPLPCAQEHILQVCYFLVLIITGGATVTINVNLNTTASCGQVCLNTSRLVAYRLP